MATQLAQNHKPHDQTQLLEKFRKLRQWQQQQQESMFRQQQQQMETLKTEQNKLQSILAAQRRLQEQTTSTASTHSPNLGTISSQAKQSSMTVQSQLQQRSRVQGPLSVVSRAEVDDDGYELVRNSSNVFPGSIPTSSVPSAAMNQRDLEMQMRQLGSQQYSGPVQQLTVNDKDRFQGSLPYLNETVYPVMWNSPNYRLPVGALPLTAGTRATPIQEQPVVGSTTLSNLMPHFGTSVNGMTEVPLSFQSPVITQGPRGMFHYNSETDSQAHLEMNAERSETMPYNRSPAMTQELERLWSHNPDVKSLADADSQVDEYSEADAMSGVYPLYDSEPEMGVNEMEEVHEEGDIDAESDVEGELEETSERNTTVIDLHVQAHSEESKGMVSFLTVA